MVDNVAINPKPSRAKAMKYPTPVHTFELIYRGSPDAYDDIEAALARPGGEDIFLAWQGGKYGLCFSRKAPTFRDAVLSALTEVECLGLGLEFFDLERIDD